MSVAIAGTTARAHRPQEISARAPDKAADRAPARAAAGAPEATPAEATQSEAPSLAARTAARDQAQASEAQVRMRLLDQATPSVAAADTAAARNGRRAFTVSAPSSSAPQGAVAAPAASTEPTTFAEVQEGLRSGRTDDAFRDGMHEVFSAASVDESHQMMEEIRSEGLLDAFLDASLRDEDGDPSDPMIKDAMRKVFETGRLDAYAETVTGHPFSLYAPTADQTSHYYSRGDGGVHINQDNAAAIGTDQLARVLAHETYHAFNHDHGGERGALNEGMGIAAADYAFDDGDYSLSEKVYGTKNYYRDIKDDADYPFGDLDGADSKLLDLTNQLAARDSSGLAWDDPDKLADEYLFWEPFARRSDVDADGNNDWEQPGGYAEQAQADVEAYRAGTLPLPEQPSILDKLWSWFSGLFD